MCERIHPHLAEIRWFDQGSYRKLDKKSGTFIGLFSTKFIFFQDRFNVLDSDFNTALHNWECLKHNALWNFSHTIKLFHWILYGTLQDIIWFALKKETQAPLPKKYCFSRISRHWKISDDLVSSTYRTCTQPVLPWWRRWRHTGWWAVTRWWRWSPPRNSASDPPGYCCPRCSPRSSRSPYLKPTQMHHVKVS